MAIDIGPEAIDRSGTWEMAHEQTFIDFNNPANASGKITTVQLWLTQDAQNVKVGTFYRSGAEGTFTMRDYASLGSVTSGSLQTFSGLDIDVQFGDYIGWYWSQGGIEVSTVGGTGIYYADDLDYFDGASHSYVLYENLIPSIHGIGYFIASDEETVNIEAGIDTHILDDNPNTNYGTAAYLLVTSAPDLYHTLMRFAISLPENAKIVSATLSLDYFTNLGFTPAGDTFTLYRVRRNDWTEDGATWNNYKSGSAWGTAGANNVQSDIEKALYSSKVMPTTYGWVNWDVKDLVIDAVYNRDSQLDLKLYAATGTTHYAEFRSSEYATASRRPTLTITYTLEEGTVAEATVQPSDIDTFIAEPAPNTNYGTAEYLLVSAADLDYYRTIIRFLLTSIPDDAVILNASLLLYYFDNLGFDPVGHTYTLYRLRRNDWVELEATWNNYKSGTAWGTAGADNTTTDIDTTLTSSKVMPPVYQWVEWFVTDLVQDAIDNRSKQLDLRLHDLKTATDKYAKFYSSEYATDTTKRPKLVITYVTPQLTARFDGQTKRIVTLVIDFDGQTQRTVGALTSYDAQTERKTSTLGAFIGQTIRTITGKLKKLGRRKKRLLRERPFSYGISIAGSIMLPVIMTQDVVGSTSFAIKATLPIRVTIFKIEKKVEAVGKKSIDWLMEVLKEDE